MMHLVLRIASIRNINMATCQKKIFATQLPKMIIGKVLLKIHGTTRLSSSVISSIVGKHRAREAYD